MRFEIDITETSDGRPAGTVTAPGGACAAFSGWLELLRLIEHGMSVACPIGEPLHVTRTTED